jgi:hypothetical protein
MKGEKGRRSSVDVCSRNGELGDSGTDFKLIKLERK